MVHRPLAILVVLALSFALVGCKKPAELGAVDAGGASTSATAPTGTNTTSGSPALGGDFEGTLTLHVTHPPAAPMDVTLSAKNGSLRMDMPIQGGQTTHSLFDSRARTVTVIMDSQKLAIITPLPKALPQGTPGAASVTQTGKHESVAGYDCEDWDIVSASGSHTQACVARGLAFFDFTALAGPRSSGSWADAVRDADGFPLRTVDLDAAGKEVSRIEVTKIEKKPLEATLFHPPAGYDSMVGGRGGPFTGVPGMGGPPPGMGGLPGPAPRGGPGVGGKPGAPPNAGPSPR